jgi:predicted TIM-barrel fold metal-dependent hydrolase
MNSKRPMSRRDVLQAAMIGAGGAVLGAALSEHTPAAEPKQPNYIDAHSHIWTRDIKQFPLTGGATLDDLDPPSFTTEELLKLARPAGVKRVVLIAHHRYYGFDNSYMIDAAQRYPGVFRIVGMVDDQKPHPDAEMRRLLKQQVTGFRITSWVRQEKWLDGPGMAAMWKCGAATGQAMCCLIDAGVLPSVDRMCEKFPDTPVVIDHFARIGVDGEIRDADVKQLCHLARHKHTHVKVSAFYALGKKQPPYLELVPMIRRLYDAFGPQRLMWASDCPYQLQGDNTYAASIGLVRDRLDFLSAEDRQWLLQKTAEKVYFFSLS